MRLNLGSRLVVPHAAQDDLLLSLMKLVRLASANNAALELIGAGYVQEVHSLWRMIDAAYDAIVSMAGPLAEAPVQSDGRDRVIDRSFQAQTQRIAQAIQRQAEYLFRSLLAVGWSRWSRGARTGPMWSSECVIWPRSWHGRGDVWMPADPR